MGNSSGPEGGEQPPRSQADPDPEARLIVSEFLSESESGGAQGSATLSWLARLLRDEGTDIMSVGDAEITRGTPVYVDGDSDLVAVQRVMARHHIRRLPVVSGDEVVGILDLVEVAMMDADPSTTVSEAVEGRS